MRHTNTARTAAVAATLIVAGLAAAVPASATEAPRAAVRITSHEQLRAGILKAATDEAAVRSGGVHTDTVVYGWRPPVL